MFHTNANYLNCSQAGNLEPQPNDEIVEEGSCKAVMVMEQTGTYRTTSSLFKRSLATSLVSTPLAILSVLGSASGSQTNLVSSYYCALSSAICGLISVNESESKIKRSIKLSSLISNHKKESFISESIPLVISGEDRNPDGVNRQLHTTAGLIYTYYLRLIKKIERSGAEKNITDYKFCRENVIPEFCDDEYNRNKTISDRCCSVIESYIPDLYYTTTHSVTTVSTTVEPEITNATTVESTTLGSTTVESTTLGSTTVESTTLGSTIVESTTLGSTTVGSTTLIPTKATPDDDKSTFVAVLIAFLSLAIVMLALKGYKCYRSKKRATYQVQSGLSGAPQPVALKYYKVKEEEDLV